MLVDYAPGWHSAFTWIVYAAFIVAFLVAFGMGANDCANSYGTVVGSGVLKLWQAYILATIFELLGAVLLGYKVTNTMRKSIVNVSIYDTYVQPSYDINGTAHFAVVDHCSGAMKYGSDGSQAAPLLNGTSAVMDVACRQYTDPSFMLGQLGALIGTAFWLILATVIHLPVSTTHSAVGATIGFSLVLKGSDGINWNTILSIVISWVASPLLAGFFSIIFYLVIKYTVFNRAYPFESSLQMMPIFYFFALTVNIFSILYNGSKYLGFDQLSWWADLLISLGIGTTTAVILWLWGCGVIRRRVLKKMSSLPSAKIEAASRDAVYFAGKTDIEKRLENGLKPVNGTASKNGIATKSSESVTGENIEIRIDSSLKDIHLPHLKRLKHPVEENPLASQVFNYLQILSACFLSFSHGSNDTANSVAPLVGLWLVFMNGHATVESQYDYTMILLILFGAISMIIGLWFLGHKVISTIGTKITQVTAPSGFAMELGTGFTVLVASKIGIPVSTTHCAVGAVVCVGWFRTHEGGVSWKIFRNIFVAWAVTLPVAGAVAALATYLLNLTVL